MSVAQDRAWTRNALDVVTRVLALSAGDVGVMAQRLQETLGLGGSVEEAVRQVLVVWELEERERLL